VFSDQLSNGNSIAEQIVNNLEKIYWKFENEFRRRKHQRPSNHFDQITWENPQPSKMITEDIPLPVLYLLTQKNFPHKIPISKVSLFSDQPVQLALEDGIKKLKGKRFWKNYSLTFERAILQIEENRITYLSPPEMKHDSFKQDNSQFLLE